MTARDVLVLRSLQALTALTALAVSTQLAVPSLRPMLTASVPCFALFATALVAALAGRTRPAAALVLVPGAASLALLLSMGGGVHGRHSAYLPLLGAMGWAWFGRWTGLATLAGSLVALAVTSVGTYPAEPRTFSLLASLLFVTGFSGAVVLELRRACDLAAHRALVADRAAQTAAADEAARDRFLATVSHELRTPLDAVLGYAALLQEDEPSPDRRQDLDRIREAGAQLAALVDDLLDMSKPDGELTLTREPTDVGSVIAEVERTAAPLVERGGNALHVVVAPGLPTIDCDPRRLRQILLNLVTNAAKYTTDGTIVVTCCIERGTLALAVRDSGVGIPAERLGELFQPFVQLHEGTARRPGVGLGLALSQRLAVRLGGRIDARSPEGEGSTFTLRLPVSTEVVSDRSLLESAA